MSFNDSATDVPFDKPQRHIVRWIVLIIVALLIAWIAWVGIRALLAYSSLHNVLTASELARADLKTNDLNKALGRIDGVSGDAANAANLTSDPAWRLAEFIPWVGQNLSAFRHSASVVNIVVNDGVGPLVDAGDAFSLSIFQPHNGTIDLSKIAAVKPAIDKAADGMKAAEKESAQFSSTWVLPQLANQTTHLAKVVSDSAAGISSIRTAVDLMPSMLGSDGPRTYLILVQNAAELRVRGGNPGAMEVVTADNGTLTLSGQGAASTFPYLTTPVDGLDAETEAIYGNLPATRIQNTTGIPDFPTGAKLAQEQWAKETGQTVDGVIAVDPGVLAYMLRASGPLTLSNGVIINADTVRQLLFQEIYSKYSNPKDQDAVFADIARTVFSAATSGQIEGTAIGSAVGRGLSEGRILMWSAQPNDQKELATSPLAGVLPKTNKTATTLGVYLNDVTGGKLGYYLDMKSKLSSGRCATTSAPIYRTDATLTFTAPADAATSLPPYVTGDGVFGVKPGLVATTMYFYGPVDADVTNVMVNGEKVKYATFTNLGRSVFKIDTLLKPGENIEVQVDFRGNVADSTDVSLEQTPMIFPNAVKYSALECSTG
jgi:Protein of unknown function (DUF4012)